MAVTPDWNSIIKGFLESWNDGDFYTKNVQAEVACITEALRTRRGPLAIRQWGREVVETWNDGDFYTKEIQRLADEAGQFVA